MKDKKNVFDKTVSLPHFRIFEAFYAEHKEAMLYLFFGGVAFFLNLLLFVGIDYISDINELINNVICWIICVLFQFFTNRTWVFDGRVESAAGFMRQMGAFFCGRIFTLLVEEVILAIFITWLGLSPVAVKFAGQIVVIILNYAVSKFFVFADRRNV